MLLIMLVFPKVQDFLSAVMVSELATIMCLKELLKEKKL